MANFMANIINFIQVLAILALLRFYEVFSRNIIISDDDLCSAEGGTCQQTSRGCEGGDFWVGLCSGALNRRCCIPNGKQTRHFLNDLCKNQLKHNLLLYTFVQLAVTQMRMILEMHLLQKILRKTW